MLFTETTTFQTSRLWNSLCPYYGMNTLNAKRVAILATNGFEENELSSPLEALQKAGAKVDIVSDTVRPIRSWKNDNWGRTMSVDQEIGSARLTRRSNQSRSFASQ